MRSAQQHARKCLRWKTPAEIFREKMIEKMQCAPYPEPDKSNRSRFAYAFKSCVLGLCTPPVETCLFVGCTDGKTKIVEALKITWSFYLAILFALILVTYVPADFLWLLSVLD